MTYCSFVKMCWRLLVMVMLITSTFRFTVGMKHFAIREGLTLLSQICCPQNLLRRESSSTRRRPCFIFEIRPTSVNLLEKPYIMSIWVSKRSCLGGQVSAKRPFYRKWTITYCHATSQGICQPQTSSLKFLAWPLLRWCSKCTGGSQILTDCSCFGGSRRQRWWCSTSSEISPGLMQCFMTHEWRQGPPLSPAWGTRRIGGLLIETVTARVYRIWFHFC